MLSRAASPVVARCPVGRGSRERLERSHPRHVVRGTPPTGVGFMGLAGCCFTWNRGLPAYLGTADGRQPCLRHTQTRWSDERGFLGTARYLLSTPAGWLAGHAHGTAVVSRGTSGRGPVQVRLDATNEPGSTRARRARRASSNRTPPGVPMPQRSPSSQYGAPDSRPSLRTGADGSAKGRCCKLR